MEQETALKWGHQFDTSLTVDRNWFDLPRDMRANLVAGEQVERLEMAIAAWEAKRERAMKGG